MLFGLEIGVGLYEISKNGDSDIIMYKGLPLKFGYFVDFVVLCM